MSRMLRSRINVAMVCLQKASSSLLVAFHLEMQQEHGSLRLHTLGKAETSKASLVLEDSAIIKP